MEFNPTNNVVQLCMQGMKHEEQKQFDKARELFQQAWNQAENDFEKFIAGWYLARQPQKATDRVKWYNIVLELASKINDDAVKGAFSSIHTNLANVYKEMGYTAKANIHHDLSILTEHQPTDKGPFYHGTRAALQTGDLLTPGRISNYHPDILMNHVYFTATISGAGLAAGLAQGNGAERIYMVEPTGDFEDDPNVTNKKFPGNPTRSYRTKLPLKITGEVTEWLKQTPDQLQQWREKLANSNGEIIN